MKARVVVLPLVIVGAVSVAVASQPGQPMDCTDWTINLPGIKRRTFAAGDVGKF